MKRADLAWAVLLAFHLDPGIAVGTGHDLVGDHALVLLGDGIVVAPTDQALDGEDGVLRIGDALPLGGLTDQNLAGIGECHHRRRRARTFGILDHLRLVALHHGNAGVGGSEIDPDCLGHDGSPVQRVAPTTIRPASRVGRRMVEGTCSAREEHREHVPVGPQGHAASLTSIFFGFAARRLRNGDLQDAVRHGRLDLRRVDARRQLERPIEHAVAALADMVVLVLVVLLGLRPSSRRGSSAHRPRSKYRRPCARDPAFRP